MNKVIKKEWRSLKEVKLPISEIVVEVYSSLLVSDVKDIDVKSTNLESGIAMLVKLIKSWNYFASETDTEAMAITRDNLDSLPSKDIEFLLNEVTDFSSEVKKN